MNSFFSHRTQIFQDLLQFQSEVKVGVSTVERFTRVKNLSTASYVEVASKMMAEWAIPYLSRAAKSIGHLVQLKIDDEQTTHLLSDAAALFNLVYHRTVAMCPSIARVAETLFIRAFSLLPHGTALQLQLFGEKDVRHAHGGQPILNVVRTFLQAIAPWWTHQEERQQAHSTGNQVSYQQLEIDFTGSAVVDAAEVSPVETSAVIDADVLIVPSHLPKNGNCRNLDDN